jgi:hypothetical protein
VTNSPTKIRTSLPEGLDPVPLPETATVTEQRPPNEIRAAIAAVVAKVADQADLADDLMIALEVRKRDTEGMGGRVELEEFMREQGYDPADFGIE